MEGGLELGPAPISSVLSSVRGVFGRDDSRRPLCV